MLLVTYGAANDAGHKNTPTKYLLSSDKGNFSHANERFIFPITASPFHLPLSKQAVKIRMSHMQ